MTKSQWFAIVKNIKAEALKLGGECVRMYSNRRKNHYYSRFYCTRPAHPFILAIREAGYEAIETPQPNWSGMSVSVKSPPISDIKKIKS